MESNDINLNVSTIILSKNFQELPIVVEETIAKFYEGEGTKVKGFRFYRDGYVRNILFCNRPFDSLPDICVVKANCLPSMKQGCYKIKIALSKSIIEVKKALCSCPAGLPGKCHHVAAVLYALKSICEQEVKRLEERSCTDELCKWIKPSRAGSTPKAFSEINIVKSYPRKVERKACARTFDPRQPKQHCDPAKDVRVKKMYSVLKEVNAGCAFVTHNPFREKDLFQGKADTNEQDLEKVADYVNVLFEKMSENDYVLQEFSEEKLLCCHHLGKTKIVIKKYNINDTNPCSQYIYKNIVQVSNDKAKKLCMQEQGSEEWFSARQYRITGSNCYSLYTYGTREQQSWTKKIEQMLCSPFSGNSNTDYGKRHEPLVRKMYSEMFKNFTVYEFGLIVNPVIPWLGFSPDGIAYCDGKPSHLIEIKCPVSGKNASIEYLAKAQNLPYLEMHEENICLKKTPLLWTMPIRNVVAELIDLSFYCIQPNCTICHGKN